MLLNFLFIEIAISEIKPKSFSITPLIGQHIFDEDQHIENDTTIGLALGYNFTEHWGVELMYNYGQFVRNFYDEFFDDCCCCELDGHILHMDALYHFRPDKRLVPYIAAGVGDRRLELDCGEKEDKFFLNYGGGIKYDITKKFSLRGDVRHIFSVDDSYNNMSVTVGLTYTIGGKEKKKLVVQQKAVPVYIPKPIIKKMKSINLNIQFDFDDATVKPQYHDHIKSVADSLIMNPNATAVIEGHTCAIGTDEYNIQLSQERANNVMKYMIKHFNIDPSRLKAIGYGRSRPIFDNDFEESRQKNRRVNAVITNE